MLERFPIRFRLSAWYSLSMAVVLALLAGASYFAMRASMYRAVDVDLRFRLSGVEEFLESRRSTNVNDLSQEIPQNNTFGVLFRIFDDSGKLIYESDPLASHHIGTDPPTAPGATIVYRDVG